MMNGSRRMAWVRAVGDETRGRRTASVVTSKPANGGRVKTGQRTVSGTELFYPVFSPSGKPVLVRQLRGPHFSRWPW